MSDIAEITRNITSEDESRVRDAFMAKIGQALESATATTEAGALPTTAEPGEDSKQSRFDEFWTQSGVQGQLEEHELELIDLDSLMAEFITLAEFEIIFRDARPEGEAWEHLIQLTAEALDIDHANVIGRAYIDAYEAEARDGGAWEIIQVQQA